MKVDSIRYRVSYDGMNKLIHKLRINIKNLPEEMQRRRETLTYRLELLYIIRMDVKRCLNLSL